jgi:CRISPR-associated Csx14 family protein
MNLTKEKVLFAPMGMSPGVIVNLLNKTDYKYSKIVLLVTNYNKKSNDCYSQGISDLIKYLTEKKEYLRVSIKLKNFNFDDIDTPEQTNNFFTGMFAEVVKEQKNGNEIHILISGGRKTMSAFAMLCGYMLNVNKVFHVTVSDRVFTEYRNTPFEVPKDQVTLLDIPIMNLSPIFSPILRFAEQEHLCHGIEEMIDKFNEIIRWNWFELKEAYENKLEDLKNLKQLIESILYSKVKSFSPRPIIQGRIKLFESIIGKVERYPKDYPTDESLYNKMRDIVAFRIICYIENDYDKIVHILQESPEFDIKSQEKHEKSSGYRAHHFDMSIKKQICNLEVFKSLQDYIFEIQVTTIFRHSWSVIEHDYRYKSIQYQQAEDEIKKQIDIEFTDSMNDLKNAESLLNQMVKVHPSSKKKS